MNDLTKRLERAAAKATYLPDSNLMLEARRLIVDLEANHESAVTLVLNAGRSTGHADTSQDLMSEVLQDVKELEARLNQSQEWRDYYRARWLGMSMDGRTSPMTDEELDEALGRE